MERTPFSLNDVLDEVAARLSPAAADGSTRTFVSVGEGVPRRLTGDPERLRRILIGLGESALAGMDADAIAAVVDGLGAGSDGARQTARLRFLLRKTGAGMTCEEAVGVLTRFLAAAPAGQSDGADSGSPRELVDDLGGSIGIASEPGHGFVVAFSGEFGVEIGTANASDGRGNSASRRDPEARIRMPDGLEHIRGARILLAEDHPVNQNLTREILTQAGCTVDIAEDGQSTIEAVLSRGGSYDAVLMDVQMPIMDGFEATRQIREQLSESALPIIAMTANVLGDERERCLAAGMNDYVPKPIHIPDLYAALIRWIRMDEAECRLGAGPSATAGPAIAGSDASTVTLPERIPQIDVESGLARAMGNQDLYADLLLQFAQTNESLGADVAAAIAKGDLELARFLVHGLASTAGNIGAGDLYAAANELEKAVVAERAEDIGDTLAAFGERLELTLDGIRQSGVAVNNRPARLGNGTAPLDPDNAAHVADRLAAMLEDQNLAAHAELDTVFEMFGGRGQDAQLQRLKASLEALEFREARVILAGICKEILT